MIPWTPSVRMGLLRLVAGQTNAATEYNDTMWWIDTFALPAADFDHVSTSPPTFPNQGDRIRVPDNAVGDWEGHDQEIAAYWNGAWHFAGKEDGWMVGLKMYLSEWVDAPVGVADIADLNQNITGPTEGEVQAISDKVDELLQKLRDANIL